jgi:restriction endonuclease S subunit
MNEVAFQELLLDARTSESVSGLRKLVLASALRGDFDDQNERQQQLSNALNSLQVHAASNKTNKVRSRKSSSEIDPSEDLLSFGNEFVVELGAIATIEKGKTGIKDAVPGVYPLVVTAEGRLTTDHFDFEGPAVIIPLVSSTGHGDASLKRIHYQDGKYAVGSILCAVQSRFPEVVHPRYLYEYLSTFKEELLVSRMSGTANVSLTVGKIAEVPVPLITYEAQEKLDRLMSLCDALEASGQLEAQQHGQLVSTLLGTLTQSETPEALADNWQRIATHFDLLLDCPEAVDALEQTILQLAVRGLLVPQGPTDEPASVLLQKIRTEKDHLIAQGKIKRDKPLPPITDEEKPFELPQGWSFARSSELVEMLNGYAFKSEWFKPTGIRLLRNLNISHGYVDWSQPACIDVNAANEFSQFNLKVSDVVLSLDRPIISTGLKYAVIQEADLPCLLLQRVARLTPHPIAMSLEFLELWLQSDLFVGKIDPGRSNGVPHISTKQVGELFVGLPPMNEQSRIVTRVNELRSLCADLRSQIVKARAVVENLSKSLVAEV